MNIRRLLVAMTMLASSLPVVADDTCNEPANAPLSEMPEETVIVGTTCKVRKDITVNGRALSTEMDRFVGVAYTNASDLCETFEYVHAKARSMGDNRLDDSCSCTGNSNAKYSSYKFACDYDFKKGW